MNEIAKNIFIISWFGTWITFSVTAFFFWVKTPLQQIASKKWPIKFFYWYGFGFMLFNAATILLSFVFFLALWLTKI